jgi:signal transduction histidine kinase
MMFAAWGVLLLATLVVGGIALRLLRNQQSQLRTATTATAMEFAETVAERMALALADVQDGLLARLRSMPLDRLEEALLTWRDLQPLVRNVFIASPDGTLLLPSPSRPATAEEASFIQRYDGLFQGRVSWESPGSDQAVPATEGSFKSLRARQQTLYALTQREPSLRSASAPAERLASAGTRETAGWKAWIWDNRLHLLGWVERETVRYGVELELIAVLAQLIDAIPEPAAGVGILAVVDDQGNVFHQRGNEPVNDRTQRLASVQIGSALPHWQISMYQPAAAATAGGGRALFLVTAMMVAVLMAALLFGGSVLLWQAQRYQLDAQQKTTFVSNVSHELKTPLTTIRMYAELMAEGRIADREKRHHYLDVIVKESRRLTRLVNNVLDFGRLEQGRKTYRLEAAELAETVSAVVETQRLRIEEAGMRLLVHLPDEPWPVQTDRDAVEQSLLNLIDNGIKYAARGGEMGIHCLRDGDWAVVCVCDRGPGIPAAQRERIFNRFHRLDDSLTARHPGSGLGLTIARRLVQGLGGDLRFEPRAGGGSRFCIRLPLNKEPVERTSSTNNHARNHPCG